MAVEAFILGEPCRINNGVWESASASVARRLVLAEVENRDAFIGYDPYPDLTSAYLMIDRFGGVRTRDVIRYDPPDPVDPRVTY